MFGVPSNPTVSPDAYEGLLNGQLEEGDTVVIEGTNRPCPRCKGMMNKLARQTGANVFYTWGGSVW
jgi:Pput_2613-like deaminase